MFLVCSMHLIICLTAFSQTKPVPMKFDDYSEESGENISLLARKTRRFAALLQKLPKSTKGVIAYYVNSTEADFCSDKPTAEKRNDYVRALLIKKYGMLAERIISKDGAYRNSTEIEFWLQPKDAESPVPAITRTGDCHCPTISVDGAEFTYYKALPLIFTANITGGDNSKRSYKWTVSGGEIIEGQGTPEIKVDISKINALQVKVDFEIDAVCCGLCINTTSFTTKIYKQ